MSVTNWPILPAPSDCENGEFGEMMIGMVKLSTRRKIAPSATLFTTNYNDLTGCERGPPRWEDSV
jgi:hypothetical protein